MTVQQGTSMPASDDPVGPVASAGTPQPRRHGAAWGAAAVGMVVVLLVIVLATRPDSQDRSGASQLVGRSAPDIEGLLAGATASTGGDGEDPIVIDLADFAGTWVVVNFFASWCVPCLVEHPELVAFDREHSRTGDAVVISVGFDDDPDAVRQFFEENGGEWTVVAQDAGTAIAYGVTGVPESFLIDPMGRVVERFAGTVTAAGIEAAMAAHSGTGAGTGGGG